jgi:proline dehydrogenase
MHFGQELMILSKIIRPLSKRFVAGETAEQAIEAARKVNAQGMAAILDFLGEDVSDAKDARRAAAEYIRLIGLIHEAKVNAAISLKVSQMGLLVSRDECLQNIRNVAAEASKVGSFVWFDMEGSALTQKTIEIFSTLWADFSNIGLCLQAYLVRTGGDLDLLSRSQGQPGASLHIRLCKGAYKEPAAIAYPTKAAVEGNYRMLAQKAFERTPRKVLPAFATHDRRLIEFILRHVAEKKIEMTQFEFQMLYGIENQYLAQLATRGFKTCVYIPYGTHWMPYLVRRLRERKENIYFLLRNVFRA